MKKALATRLRITPTGKIMRRQMSQDHFRAKRTGKMTRNKRKGVVVHEANMRAFKRYF